jgi:hypothetical protein
VSVKTQVTLSEKVARLVESQVESGRFADFSAAIQEAAWNYFVTSPAIYEEYGVTPQEVENAGKRERKKITEARKKGTLKRWE